MFKKKPNIKPLAPLKSSERRRIADQVIGELNLKVPSENDADPEDDGSATVGRTHLRNSLLPDNTLSARFTTTTGIDLQQASGTVFVGSHEGQEQRILWVKSGDRIYPTVYTLWHNAGILPLLHTPPVAVSSIQRGADLMTPGLAQGPPFPEGAKKDALVAIASTQAPSVPMAVGICEVDVSALQSVQGAKGHAVKILHWCGDELWAWNSSGKPGKEPPGSLEGWQVESESIEPLVDRAEAVKLEDVDDGDGGGVPLSTEGTDGIEQIPEQSENGPPVDEDSAEVVEARELTTAEIDGTFRKAFLYGVRHFMDVNNGQPNYGLEFPLSQSFVMSALVQPFLPSHTQAQATSLQIKRTSWKSIKKFIKYLDKQQIVKSKDRDGNEVVILGIDFEDQHIKDFVPYRLPKKEAAAGNSQSRGEKSTVAGDASDPSIGQKLKRVEIYRPKEKLDPLFKSAEVDPRGFYTAAEMRPIVTTYVEKEELISPSNRRLVKIDSVLADAVFDGSQPSDKEALSKGTVPRDALIDRVIQSCNSFFAILRNGEPLSSVKPKAGAPPKINIVMETRSGNKTVTKVSGVEAYFVSPQPLADELRKTCAGSTSVEQLKGSSPKSPVMEIMVQGPQRDAVIKALEKRGINKQWIETVDKTKGKKKG